MLAEIPRFLSPKGLGLVLTQSLIDNNGQLLIAEEILKIISQFFPRIQVRIIIQYEHLLTSEAQMRKIVKNSFSHFCLAVLEVKWAGQSRSPCVSIAEGRPIAKKLSDSIRVRKCQEFWRGYLINKCGDEISTKET